MSSLALQLQDYRLTTAQILYHMPDHPNLLQEFIWQELDLAPRFPVLTKFLKFWEKNLDGKLHSVTVAHSRIIIPSEFRAVSVPTPGGPDAGEVGDPKARRKVENRML